MAEIVKAFEAMEIAATVLDAFNEDTFGFVTEAEWEDAKAVYSAGVQVFAAARIAEAHGIQAYDQLPIPSYMHGRFWADDKERA